MLASTGPVPHSSGDGGLESRLMVGAAAECLSPNPPKGCDRENQSEGKGGSQVQGSAPMDMAACCRVRQLREGDFSGPEARAGVRSAVG